MKREEAIQAALTRTPEDAAVICCNGHISRQVYAVQDTPGQFYMIGSMGLAPSIGLGIALAQPERVVVVYDGDGNVLMGMGSLAQIAARKPRRFLHLCFDNERHQSTGGQKTISSQVALEKIAAAAGYAWTGRASTPEEVVARMEEALEIEGPAFLLIKVEPGGLPKGTARVDPTPEEMTERLRRFLTH